MENKYEIKDYCDYVVKDFTKQYLQELDDRILQMLQAFGYEGKNDEASEWLEKHNFDLRMNEDRTENGSLKTIYLVDTKFNMTMALFCVKIEGFENLSYKISDVIIRE